MTEVIEELDKKDPKRFDVTVRTLAGHHYAAEVHQSEKVGVLATKATTHFVERGELTAGSYALTLPRLAVEAQLDPTATLHEAGVLPHDVLVLVSRVPQTDG